jgi:hypothetical protein
MTLKKTVQVPLAADGVPIVVHAQQQDKTRELPALDPLALDEECDETSMQAAPRHIVDDEVTVPVQSSIESTLTFEVLRRQSTEEDDDEKKP